MPGRPSYTALKASFCLALFLLASLTAQAQPPRIKDTHWELHGRISMSPMGLDNTARLRWLQCDDYYEIDLRGPLGIGGNISKIEEGVVLDPTFGRDYYADSPEELAKRLGWDLPVTALAYWSRGLAALDSFAILSINEIGQATRLSQNQWRLAFRYADGSTNKSLPTRIDAYRNGVAFRLLVDSYAKDPKDCEKHKTQ